MLPSTDGTLSRNFALTWLLLYFAGFAHSGEIKTLVVPFPEGRDKFTYDASRTNVRDLQHWVELSPVLSQDDGLQIVTPIWMCADPPHCGSGFWFNAKNAEVAQGKNRKKLERLRNESFPPDIAPIVEYLKAVQEFGYWINEQEIKFFHTKDISILEGKYTRFNIDLKNSCASQIEAVRDSKDEITEWKLVQFQWFNCALHNFLAVTGGYPQAVWDAVLKARGIQEHPEYDPDGQDE